LAEQVARGIVDERAGDGSVLRAQGCRAQAHQREEQKAETLRHDWESLKYVNRLKINCLAQTGSGLEWGVR
jgi:hypothetical protein